MTSPKANRWKQAADKLTALLAQAPQQRQAALSELRQADPDLARCTSALLDATEIGESFDKDHIAPGNRVNPLALPSGFRISHFTVEEAIATGGMGAVYRARQDAPDRPVALKVMRGDMIAPDIRQRFAEEVEILGRLKHRGIAQIFEAGELNLSGTSIPYFAMDYVDGLTLDKHVERLALPVNERVELFLQLLDAVQYAHQNGIIHRDLKPANVMVDSRHQVRILDFGIARLQRRDGAGPTEAGTSPGTLAYMSPEQLDDHPETIDTRSDIYALGAMLFELLSKQRAFNLERLSLMQAIEQRRWSQPPSLAARCPELSPDLDAIVAKAMAPDCEQRYASASEFAADLRRHLDDLPILARRAGLREQIPRFFRRHRAISLTILALAVSLLAGLVATTSGYREARYQQQLAEQERDRALRAEQTALNLRDYFNQLLALAAPGALGPELRVSQLLDYAEAGLDKNFSDQPGEQAALAHTLGWVHFLNGDYERAEDLLERSWKHHQALYGEADPRTVEVQSHRIQNRIYTGQSGDLALPHARMAMEQLGSSHPNALQAQHILALWQHEQGDLEAAEATLRQAIGQAAGTDEVISEIRLSLQAYLGSILSQLGQYAQAERVLREIGSYRSHSVGDRHPDTLVTLSNLAETLTYLGQYDQAEALIRQVLEDGRRVWPPGHATLITIQSGLADTLVAQTRYQEAEAHAREAYQAALSRWGENHRETLMPLNAWLVTLLHLEQWPQARQPAVQLLQLTQTHFGSEHPFSHHAHDINASVLTGLGEHELALDHAERAYLGALAQFGETHRTTLVVRNNHARTMEAAGRSDSAQQVYQAVIDAWLEQYPEDDNTLARLYRNLGRSLLSDQQGEAAQRALSQSIRHFSRLSQLDQGEMDTTQGLLEQARALASEAGD